MSGHTHDGAQQEGVTDVSIETWAAGGRGLGRVGGRVWMVTGAVPGDQIEALPVKVHDRFVEAVVQTVTQPSALRRVPPCPIQAGCGGCPMMVVGEIAQREAKRRFVIDALQRIGRLSPAVPVDDIVAAPPELGYRNKIELSFGRDPASRAVLGFHRAGAPAELIDVDRCLIADPRLQPLLAASRSFFLGGAGSSEPAIADRRGSVRLVLRASSTRDERLIALRGLDGPFPSAGEFARMALAADPGLVGVVRLIAGLGRRGGAVVEAIAGRSWIAEEILGTSYEVPAATFLQVHPGASELLGRFVLERAKAARDVLELYAGIGGLALALARDGAHVTIVDADPAAIACAAKAAEREGLTTARFECADVAGFLSAQGRATKPDLVIADPPRTGLGRGVAARVAALGAAGIAMISCDPATLARDLAELTARGYAADRITPFDLFPQTAHVETVTWLTRVA